MHLGLNLDKNKLVSKEEKETTLRDITRKIKIRDLLTSKDLELKKRQAKIGRREGNGSYKIH